MFNLPKFHQVGPQDFGRGNLLSKIFEGYKQGGIPAQERRAEEKSELENALARHKAKYYPLEQEQKLQESELDIGAKRLNLEDLPAAIEAAKKKRDLELKYYGPLQEALLSQRQAAAERARMGPILKPTKIQQNLAGLGLQPGTEEYDQAYRRMAGLPVHRAGVPEGAVPLDDLPKNEQLDITKRMRNDLRTAHDIEKADKTLDEMKAIMKSHPGLADSFSNIFMDPRDTSTLSKLKKTFLNSKERAAVEKFTKLSNDLILHAGQAIGSKNFTDAKLKLLELAKPTSLNTQEANLFLIDKMKAEFSPWKKYSQELQSGLKNRYAVEFNLENSGDISSISDEELDAQLGVQ